MRIPIEIINLLKAVGVFLLFISSSWGLGDTIISLFVKSEYRITNYARGLMAFALGSGIIGQIVFIIGLRGNFYQQRFFWPFILSASIYSLFRFKNVLRELKIKSYFLLLTKTERFIVFLFSFILFIWLWGSLSFITGSDVITYHYPFVKTCINLKHFGHGITIPFGFDVLSSYSPALIHMQYLVVTLLSDARAANLLHWFINLMLIAGVYVFSRDFLSRESAFMAITIYAGFSVLFNFSLDVNNYPALAVFMIIAVYCLFIYQKTLLRRHLILAGLFAGLMLSTKYYALALMLPLALLIVFFNFKNKRRMFIDLFIFITIAFLVYSPWVIYNLKEFGVPVYPNMGNLDFMNRWIAIRREQTLEQFIIPFDRGYFWPKALYYLSAFIPFEPDYRVFGLTPIFLIGIPCSVYYLIHAKGEKYGNINMLFIISFLSCILVEAVSWPYAFYKTWMFAAVLYAISLSGLFILLSKKSKRWIWIAVIWIACINTFVECRYLRTWLHMPLVMKQEFYWDPLVKYLNQNLEKDAAVASYDIRLNYYLRDDIRGLPAYGVEWSTSWRQEESLIRQLDMKYYIYNKNEKQNTISYYQKMIGVLNQFSAFERADSIRITLNLYEERTRQQELFLAKFGRQLNEFPDGNIIYILNYGKPSTKNNIAD